MKQADKKEIESLRITIHNHVYHYYVKNSPSILDREYDALYQLLKELETKKHSSQQKD